MKNMFARRLIAGLAGAGLAIGGLVAPAALPQAMAGDIIVDLTPPVLAQITWATTLAQGATGTLDVKAGSTWDDATYTTEAIVDGGPPVGTATLDAGGTLTFTPDPDFAGLATIRYSITDQVGQTATQTVTVRVAAKPTLSASPLTGATALEGSTAEFVNQLATDTTSGAMPATCNIVSTPASAATVSNSGVVNYQNAVQGDYTFAVTCTDSLGQTTNEVVNTLLVHSVSVDIETTVARTTVFVGDPQAGDEIAWTYTVTNRGTATLTGLVITPSLPDIGTVTCDKTSLTPTSPVAICQATSTLTQDQVDAKKVEDQAVVTVMASGETFGNGAIEFSSPLTTLTVQPLSSLSITKTASLADTNGNGKADPGEVVTFTIVVTNTSDMPLTAVGVTDSWPDLKLTCDQPNGLGGLYPTDQMTCTATHTVTAQEVIAGGTLTNTATATGVDEVGYTRESVGEATVLLNHLTPPALAQISWDTPLTQGGSVAIDVKTGSTWDDNATYTTEAIVDGDAAVGTASLDASTGVLTFTPDASFSGEATIHYTITDQAGQSSTATVTVTVAGAPTLAAATPDTQTVLVGQTAVFNNTITVDETVGVTPAGCTIVSGPDGATVSPDAVVSYTATDPGEFEIVFSCQDSLGQQTPEVTNKVHVPATGLDLQVSAELTTGDPDKPMAGDVVTWTYTVTNTGSDMESGLVIVPGSTAVSNLTCPIDALAGGESTICTGTMTLTQQDIDAGMVALFEAQAKDVAYSDIESLDLISNYVTMSFELTQVGSSTTSLTATLDDTNGNGLGDPGETITYETVVENTGNVTLRDVQVTSDTLVCQPVDLAPGEQTTCVGQYEITIADVNNSKTLTDTAQSTASTPGGQTVTSSSQATSIELRQPVKVELVDDVVPTPIPQGGTITHNVMANDTLDPAAPYIGSAHVVDGPDVGTANLDWRTGDVTFTATPGFSGKAEIVYTIMSVDEKQYSATMTVNVAAAPTLTAADPATLTVLVGQTAVFNNTLAVDETSGVTPAGCTITSGPEGATISPDAVVSYTATEPGVFEITFTCQDSLGQTTGAVTNTVTVVTASLGAGPQGPSGGLGAAPEGPGLGTDNQGPSGELGTVNQGQSGEPGTVNQGQSGEPGTVNQGQSRGPVIDTGGHLAKVLPLGGVAILLAGLCLWVIAWRRRQREEANEAW